MWDAAVRGALPVEAMYGFSTPRSVKHLRKSTSPRMELILLPGKQIASGFPGGAKNKLAQESQKLTFNVYRAASTRGSWLPCMPKGSLSMMIAELVCLHLLR